MISKFINHVRQYDLHGNGGLVIVLLIIAIISLITIIDHIIISALE